MQLSNPLPIPQGRLKISGTTHYSIPGVEASSAGTFAISANTIRYAPIYVTTPITIDQMAIEVTTGGAASTTARLGIYNADLDWQPTSLVVDAGTVAVDSTGVKIASVNVTLPPGRYLLALNSDGAPTLRRVLGGAMFLGYANTLGASPFIVIPNTTQTYGVLPNPGTAISNISSGSSASTHHYIFLRTSAP